MMPVKRVPLRWRHGSLVAIGMEQEPSLWQAWPRHDGGEERHAQRDEARWRPGRTEVVTDAGPDDGVSVFGARRAPKMTKAAGQGPAAAGRGASRDSEGEGVRILVGRLV